MTDSDRLKRFLRTTMRNAGRQLAEAKRAYGSARESALADLPADDQGRAKLVCRRHADRRAVRLDSDARPVCFESEHPDCEGCVEDIRAGCVETWE